MNKQFIILLVLCLPLFLMAGQVTLSIDLSDLNNASGQLSPGWGTLSSPGYPQLPVKTVNIVLPPAVDEVQFSHQFSGMQSYFASAPAINPAFSDGERILTAPHTAVNTQQVQFRGLGNWGDIRYASFSVMPAIFSGANWQAYNSLQISLSWADAEQLSSNRIPTVFKVLDKAGKSPREGFFANSGDLAKWYSSSQTKNYDYLIVSTPALYSAVAPLEAFRQGQGMITAFADITTILASSPGNTQGEKLRNYLINQYSANNFSYVLLVGDYDLVPVLNLIPEPDGGETIPSDFFYGDLSSIIDTDNDGRLGEYSTGTGNQDYLCDFTPEVFVGRISSNSATTISQIVTRTIAYEQASAAWKDKILLPAAYLNYGGEPETIYLQTDGATPIEYARNTVLRSLDCTTMYEQIGYIPSYASDLDLDYDLLKNELSTTSYGILNWSAHGSSSSSARKVWMSDDNQNNLPDSWEMQWMDMVDKQSFDNLVNQDGLILFCASCYNGMIDNDQQSLAEYALQKKAVTSVGATRTGWYKIGWANPGWGGLGSYNHHWLENLVQYDMSVGAASAYANLLHTQYYMFGDPVDAGGIIWPELQNVYTYLLYGDPAVGHVAEQIAPSGEILVWEPMHRNGIPVVNALNDCGRYNVVYTDKLIPDYNYLGNFEAIFCLFNWGDTAYILETGSMEYNLLNSYLENGGKLYMEGDVGWGQDTAFWQKFGASAPLDVVVYIEGVECSWEDTLYSWQYDQTDPQTYALMGTEVYSAPVIFTNNTTYPDFALAIHGSNGNYVTVASAFSLAAILEGDYGLADMTSVILDILGDTSPVANDDDLTPPLLAQTVSYPNPFSGNASLKVQLNQAAKLELEIFNVRGQKVHSQSEITMDKGTQELLWNGKDLQGAQVAPGIYFWRLKGANILQQGKMLKLSQ